MQFGKKQSHTQRPTQIPNQIVVGFFVAQNVCIQTISKSRKNEEKEASKTATEQSNESMFNGRQVNAVGTNFWHEWKCVLYYSVTFLQTHTEICALGVWDCE